MRKPFRLLPVLLLLFLFQHASPIRAQEEEGPNFEATGPEATISRAESLISNKRSIWDDDAVRDYEPSYPGAVADQVALLQNPNEYVRVYAACLLAKFGDQGLSEVLGLLRSANSTQRLAGARAAHYFCKSSDRLAPILARILKDEEEAALRRAAASSLRAMAPQSVPLLIDALKDRDEVVRRIAAEALAQIFISHPDASDKEAWGREVTGRCGDWHNHKAIGFNYGLKALFDYIPSVIPAAEAALNDKSEEVRAYAAILLFKLGAFAESSAAGLSMAREDSSPIVRYWAQAALNKVRPMRWESLRLYTQKVRTPGEEAVPLAEKERRELIARVKTARGWEFHEPEGNEDIPWPGEEDPRWSAAQRLIRCEMPNLVAAAEGPAPSKAAEAAEVLDLLERAFDQRVFVLMRFVDEDTSPCCKPAQKELTEMGPAVLPALAYDWLRWPRFPVGPGTYDSLTAILERLGGQALPVFIQGLEHWRDHEVVSAIGFVKRLGPTALPAAPIILSAWRYGLDFNTGGYDPWWDREDLGGLIMASFGPGALPWLERALEDEKAVVRARACRNLGAMGEAAAHLLPKIAPLLEEPDRFVRREAAGAYLKLAPEWDPLVPRAEAVLRE